MPIYNFKCPSCNTIEERLILQSEKSIKCNSCNAELTKENSLPSAPHIVSGVGFNSKVPEGFKDKLREIKKTGGIGSKIDV